MWLSNLALFVWFKNSLLVVKYKKNYKCINITGRFTCLVKHKRVYLAVLGPIWILFLFDGQEKFKAFKLKQNLVVIIAKL